MHSLKFGTSGLRGLAVELAGPPAYDYTVAFLKAVPSPSAIAIGQDLRSSSPTIAQWVAGAAQAMGIDIINLRALPTPALALFCDSHRVPGIMITGSHIPDDRNGLKFYTSDGEINKDDEAAILAAYAPSENPMQSTLPAQDESAVAAFKARYAAPFNGALSGLTVGVYQHSSVARDVLMDILANAGARPVALGRSDTFIPVDTEALRPEDTSSLAAWAAEQSMDAIISTDGDADRPLVADETGTFVLGDTVGALTARYLGATAVATPVTSNSALEARLDTTIVRTRVGSPYVIEAMKNITSGTIVGFEANGGVLLGSDATVNGHTIAALETRDCVLPILSVLAEIKARGAALSSIVADLAMNAKFADRLQSYPRETSQALIASIAEQDGPVYGLAHQLAQAQGDEITVDNTDGLKFAIGTTSMHFRPSGNAPELRVYCEADTPQQAEQLARQCLAIADNFRASA
ncbi:MAG: phosphomannomutase [Ahrensia sp.]